MDGALVFVDISGFTAMSERLAVLGREGAERVTEIIDGAFSNLLGHAYALGGSLLKFGGDALLLLFDGDDAAIRAAAAAYDMRDALHRLGAIKTSAGAVELDMSVGVHVGSVDLFLVGHSHRELLVIGPAASAVVRTEGDAGAGRILLSPEAAAALTPDLVGEGLGSGFTLLGRPEARESGKPVAPEPSQTYWRAVSTALRRHLVDDGRDRFEHRRAVVGFVHFEDTDQILVDVGHDRMADALDELVAALQVAVDRRQLCLLASDVDDNGGKLIVTAGVPATHEDDVDRMLLAMREFVEAHTEVPVRIGVHGGPLFAGEVGPSFRRTFTVMGDVVNTAARVMSRAGTHQVLATDELLAAATLRFGLESVPPFAVKGKAEPLVASVVGPAQFADASMEDVRPPATFVGRAAELADLVRRFDRARVGNGSAVELVGAAGVGKTEILRAFLDLRPDASPVVLRCQKATSDVAYRPVRAAMLSAFDIPVNAPEEEARAQLRRTVGALLGDQLDVIEVAIGLRPPTGEVDPTAFRIDLAGAVDSLLRLSFPHGLVLVVENAQWIDDGTADLVRAMSARASDRPYLVAVTSRESTPTLGGVATTIEPLDEFHATELALIESAHRLLPPVANALARRAGGNPLFVVELVHAVLGGGRTEDAEDDDALPGTLEALLAERIDRLPPSDRALVRQLAVLGSESEIGEVASFVEVDRSELVSALERLDELVLFDRERDTIRFRQALLVDAAYGGLSYRRRRDLHGRAADLLVSQLADPSTRAEDLSRHCSIAAQHQRAWTYSLEAGGRSAARAAFAQATVFFRRALAVSRRVTITPEARAEAYRMLGHSAMIAGQHDLADQALRRAARLVSSDVEVARVAINRGQLARERSEHVSAVRHFRRGRRMALAANVDDELKFGLLARSFLGEAAVRMMQEAQSGEARKLALEGLRNADAAGDELLAANACTWLVQAATFRDAEALELGRRAADIYRRHGRRRHLAHVDNALGGLLFERGRGREAMVHAERAIATLDELGLPAEAAVGRLNLAFRLEQQDRRMEAVAVFEEAERVFEVLEHPLAAYAAGMRAAADAAGSEIEDAFDRYRSAAARLHAATQGSMADDVHLAWAEVMIERGEAELAARALESIVDQHNAELTVRRPRLDGRLSFLAGDLDRAILLAEEAVMVATEAGDEYQLARALDLRADVTERSGGRSRGASDRQRARELLTRFGVVHAI